MNWSNPNVDISKPSPMFSYHCAKLTVQNKFEPGLLWELWRNPFPRLQTKLGKAELTFCTFWLLLATNASGEDTETLSTGEKMLTFWLGVNLSSFNKPVQQQASIVRWEIARQNVLYLKYIAILIAYSQQLSDNPLSLFIGVADKAAFLHKILKMTA